MELTYTQKGDYLYPNLVAPERPKIGKYGMLRRTFLIENKHWAYSAMQVKGTLNQHLEEVDAEANRMVEDMVEKMKVKYNVTEKLKAEDQMKWIGMMNSIIHSAEEVVYNELIYV